MSDFEIAYLAVSSESEMFRYISKDLRNNYEMALAALRKDISKVPYITTYREKLFQDINVVKIFIEYDGSFLRYANQELKNNYQLVKSIVQNNGNNLIYASKELQNNKELLEELKNNRKSIESENIDWYNERMEVLKMLKEETYLKQIVKSIFNSSAKKIKF